MSARRPVLRDPALDATLREHGWVRLRLLDDAAVARLVAAWRDLRVVHPPRWDPTGFAATIRDHGARFRADEVIRSETRAAFETVLLDHAPFMSAFLTKQAGSGELPAHLDWRLLDESPNRTYGGWIALTDATGDHGVLGVVARSHHLVDFDRTPESPGHDWTWQLVESGAERVLIPAAAGDAVIYDHRLVHFSEPNRGAEERLAVNVGLAPVGLGDTALDRLLAMTDRSMTDQVGPS